MLHPNWMRTKSSLCPRDPSQTTFKNVVWASTGRTQEQWQNHGWNAKSIFILLPCKPRDPQISTCAETHGWRYRHWGPQSMLEDHSICLFHLYLKDSTRKSSFHCALIFLIAEKESQACLIRCLSVYHRPVLSIHRGSICQAHKTK